MTASERIQKRNERMHAMFERGRELKKLQLFDELISALTNCLPACHDFVGKSAQPYLYHQTVIEPAESLIARAKELNR